VRIDAKIDKKIATTTAGDMLAQGNATRCARRWCQSAMISGSRTSMAKVFKVDGKALRLRQTLVFEDAHGRELCKIQERMLRVKDSMEIEDPHGGQIAMVKKALISPVRERWVVKIKGGHDLEVKGSILDHEYSIGEGHDKVAEVSKKWFRLRDSYGVAIDPGQDDVLILAVAVCIDEMAHEGR
jgi:uncharacterized protein YxjI